MQSDLRIPEKANRVLNFILAGLLLILLRVWYLEVIQREEQQEIAHKPQRRTVIEQVQRATIRDRHNELLAENKIQYSAAICYAPIREIPSAVWKKDAEGKKVKILARAEYITELSALLSQELGIESQLIEDLIHGKAALFPHTPFIIKEDLTEAEYARLKMLKKDYRGIEPQLTACRIYPHGKVGCDVIGYLGAISGQKYSSIAEEMGLLQSYIAARESGEMPFLPEGFDSPVDVRQRLSDLQEKSYAINDFVGKMGIENSFDEELRGFCGKKIYEVDVKGNYLRELPGTKKAVSGQRIVLAISAELQEFAESLLTKEEEARHEGPWIKGGAIVAMVPKTGEVVALASYPRFDPSDFIPARDPVLKKERRHRMQRWLENESYLAEIWDGARPMEKEYYSEKRGFYDQEEPLTWECYLEKILSPKSSLYAAMKQVKDLKTAIAMQDADYPLLKTIISDEDRLLAIDLCRMAVYRESFDDTLLKQIGDQSLSFYRRLCGAHSCFQKELYGQLQEIFHEIAFKEWRSAHFKDFLKEMRLIEKKKKRGAKPYTDYLEIVEKKCFKKFWQENRLHFFEALLCDFEKPEIAPYLQRLRPIASHNLEDLKGYLQQLPEELRLSYLMTMRSFDELDRPLLGSYRFVRNYRKNQLEKHLAAAFYPPSGLGYGRSLAYREPIPQGSVFKLVTAYAALIQKRDLPTIVDANQTAEGILGYTESGDPIHRNYKEGKLPRTHSSLGRVDFLSAMEQSSNLYFSLLAGDVLDDPANLIEAARLFGFGERTGIDLPGENRGNVPDDIAHNRTGLYSFAIGQHTLTVTPLQTANMLAAIAGNGELLKPNIVKLIAGKEPDRQEELLFSESDYPFKEELALLGISFPFFTETQKNQERASVLYLPNENRRSLFLPSDIRYTLFKGMEKVILGAKGTARPSLIRDRDYESLKNQLVGKTGTAEILFKQTIDAETPAEMKKHIWFAGISLENDHDFDHPELVVVVCLRFGQAGREAAPLAAQIIKKWRELKLREKS